MLSCRLARLSLQKNICLSNFNRQSVITRLISTSKKKSDASGTTTAGVSKPKSTWQSYGFGLNETSDHIHMHLTFFFGVTVTFILGGFYVAYAPHERDWEQREAFLELRRREENGLPLIDPNYIDPKLVKLPSESELAGVEVII